ncbi:cytochrome c5 family protein [uncultured Psychrobacter sp.]|uniref:cytochrome c5 family protein n=1 Tax=uncultured Psychrobacter sp. TaxID=259303 RepID=UPI003459634B
MRKTVLNTALWTALVVSLGVSVSACSGGEGSHEVLAVDRVEEAAELARTNAPEAEDFEFAETESMLTTMVVPEAGATDVEGAEAVEGGETEDLAVNVGAQLYDTQCMACHANGLLGAPTYGDAAAWAPRIEKGLDTLTDHSANGFNQMPAQAVNGVTVEQIRSAVEYMVDAAS